MEKNTREDYSSHIKSTLSWPLLRKFKKQKPSIRLGFYFLSLYWCTREDLNLHEKYFSQDPQSCASTVSPLVQRTDRIIKISYALSMNFRYEYSKHKKVDQYTVDFISFFVFKNYRKIKSFLSGPTPIDEIFAPDNFSRANT